MATSGMLQTMNNDSPKTRTDQVDQFIHTIFRSLDPGFIEVRLIEDKSGGSLVGRRWYYSADTLIENQPKLRVQGDRKKAGVFYGVLPRKESGKGTAADVLAGQLTWVDIDFKDYDGGEAEARERLTSLQLRPSIVVASGHGLHAFFMLRESAEPEALSRTSRALARAVGGDHAFDAARILRLPGTRNWKDPEQPVSVGIEVLDADRVYNLTEVHEALEVLGVDLTTSGQTQDLAVDGAFTGPLHPEVRARLDANTTLRNLFEGRGKRELDDEGRELDSSSSGFDFSLALALHRKGVVDPGRLANAIWNRPDEAARAKGARYVRRTVANVLKRAALIGQQNLHTDFTVDTTRVYASNPPVYEFDIAGTTLRLRAEEICSSRLFTREFTNTFRRIPQVPTKADQWRSLVNGWLENAEEIEMPPDASEEYAIEEAVERIVDDLPVGQEILDLDNGRALMLEARRFFKTDAVKRRLEERWPKVGRNELCRLLRRLGYTSTTRKVAEAQARGWMRA